MIKYSYKNDYSEATHPQVLSDLTNLGNIQFEGYGLDEYSLKAENMIRIKIKSHTSDVHFISGGTHANLTVLSSVLRPHEAVIAPSTGHISVHETGAIEATGHKICTREGFNGKLSVTDIQSVLDEHGDDEHMVKPRLVYISLTTECGTVYTKSELTQISEFCRSNDLYLYIDGARLGAAVNSDDCDLDYPDIAALSDAFFIGGTKNGALFGEAIVISNEQIKKDFRYILKQRGGLLAKTAIIGTQFCTLFTDGLYDKLAKHSNQTAKKLADGIKKAGYEFLFPVQSNIIIPLFPHETVKKLLENYAFYEFKNFADRTAVRLVTSWAAPETAVSDFINDLNSIS